MFYDLCCVVVVVLVDFLFLFLLIHALVVAAAAADAGVVVYVLLKYIWFVYVKETKTNSIEFPICCSLAVHTRLN